MTRWFATCALGVEPWLLEEIEALELPDAVAGKGGVGFGGGAVEAMRACLWLRCPSRVLEILTEGPAESQQALYRLARGLDWSRWIGPAATFRVDATVSGSRLEHSGYVGLKVKDGLVDALRAARGARPDVAKASPDVRVRVRLYRNRATIAVDLSGPLHRRSPPTPDRGVAPLRESLAAALVRASGWRGERPLYDPFCGGGTLIVEAALLATGRAPGLSRAFPFLRLPGFPADAWLAMRQAALRAGRSLEVPLLASDRDPAQVARARALVEAAGLAGSVQVRLADALCFDPSAGAGVILTNPPYGERQGEGEQIPALYKAFGDRLKEVGGGCDLWWFTLRARLGAIGLAPKRRVPFRNGDLDCRLGWFPILARGAGGYTARLR